MGDICFREEALTCCDTWLGSLAVDWTWCCSGTGARAGGAGGSSLLRHCGAFDPGCAGAGVPGLLGHALVASGCGGNS